MTFAELLTTTIITFGFVSLCAHIISIYTEMVRLMGRITRSLARIEMLRCRLMDELPKLIKICEADLGSDEPCIGRLRVARHELEAAAGARDRNQAELRLTDALDEFFAAVEAHPGLQNRPPFERLYHRVTDLESQIEECRSIHDETATVFNTRIEGFGERLVAGWLSLEPVAPLGVPCDPDRDDSVDLAVSA